MTETRTMTNRRPRLDLTPWARDAINVEARVALLRRVPSAHTLRIAGGKPGHWSAYLVNRSGCVASTQREVSWRAAADAVLGLDAPEDDWFEDEDGYVKAPLSYENREGDPAFNGAFDRW